MHILLAEDSAIYQELIGDYVAEWGFELTVVSNGADAWQVLRQPNSPKLAMLDWILPDFDGIDICRKIRRYKHEQRYTYVVLLTGRRDKQDPVQAMDAGADDLLLKPFDAIELKARLCAGKRILELQEQLIAAQDLLRHAATHDSLTRIWNRAGILEFLDRELARSRRQGNPIGVAMIDVDHFKSINDSVGHIAGDCILRQVGEIVSRRIRDYDAAGRYGGEEFVVIFPDCDLSTVRRRAEELRARIASTRFEAAPDKAITVSIGVAAIFGASFTCPEDVLREVDGVLYSAKRKGRNRVESTASDCLPADFESAIANQDTTAAPLSTRT